MHTSPKRAQKCLNYDLRFLCNWLLANKISLNASKTELIHFKKPTQSTPKDLNIKINGLKLTTSPSLKYLGVYLDEYLNGSAHCSSIFIKLKRAIGILSKSKQFVNFKELLSIYYATFSSILTYGCQVWGINSTNHFKKIQILQNDAIRILSNLQYYDHVSPSYKEHKILKIKDQIKLLNCLLVHDFFNNKLPISFDAFFMPLSSISNHKTRNSNKNCLFVPSVNTVRYGRKTVKIQAINDWNSICNDFPDKDLVNISRHKLKSLVKLHLLNTYV